MLLLLAAMSLSCTAGMAQKPADPGRSLDEELLKDLNADPLDDFDRQLFEGQKGRAGDPAAKPAAERAKPGDKPPAEDRPAPGTKPDEDFQQRLRKELGAAAISEEQEPLLEIARSMHEAQGRISQSDGGRKTQELQAKIIADLDRLLEQARKSATQSGAPQPSQSMASRQPVGQPKPGAGGSKSSDKPATGAEQKPRENAEARKADVQAMRDGLLKQIWGELPPQVREQMKQWSDFDEFLPKYEIMIEDYFRSLTEEKKK